MKQDKEKDRKISKTNYVNEKWLLNCINKNCHNCKCNLYLDFHKGTIKSNISTDRIDCQADHNIYIYIYI